MKYFLSFGFVALALIGLWLLVSGRADTFAKALDAAAKNVNMVPGTGNTVGVTPGSFTAPTVGATAPATLTALESELSLWNGESTWMGSPFGQHQYPVNPLTGRTQVYPSTVM